MSGDRPQRLHGTCVSLGGFGVLLRGAPGAGKSELALRLIDTPGYGGGETLLRGVLVADDQTEIAVRDGALWASPPARLAGLLELRGQGIITLPYVTPVRLALLVDLVAGPELERLPVPASQQVDLSGVMLPRIALDRSQPAAPSVIRAVLTGPLNQLPDRA